MMRLLKFLLTYNLKNSQPSRKVGGFTLIELLVGLALAFLIITPLLGFVVNMLQTDRQEQAKATSEQEIQAALDYIARDLDQSFFIYDGWGLKEIKDKLPKIEDAMAGAKGEAVLVFWKRQFLRKALPIRGKTINDCPTDPKNCDDAFVYSLVSYYLIKDNTCNNSTWSCTTRIGRIELKDALYDVNNRPNQPVADKYEASPGLVNISKLLEQTGTLEDQLNDWTKGTPQSAYDYSNGPKVEILIDYIDQSTGPDVPQPACSQETRPKDAARPDGKRYPAAYEYRQVPKLVKPEFETGSFYACVDTDQTVAQVFIRGNALARTRSKANTPTYVPSQSAYFPRANVQAQGRGLLKPNQSSQ
jgi:type II secretory pathway pseudopilin PulG